MKKKFVFITGPSESGKSGAAEYMEKNFDDIRHLKMRDVIRIANSKADDNTEQFWREYIDTAEQMSEGKSIIIMDTLRKPESALILSEASLKNRVIREYIKLKKEGKKFSVEDVMQRTKDKDIEKEKCGLKGIRNLIKGQDGKLQLEGTGELFSHIINNDGTIDELYEKLNQFVFELQKENKKEIER